ncbi:helix-turn-helix domain-containing protein [Bacillus sp. PK3_68]|uniref:helix-turn-helix domain-containing protein n=1 Tax=Bacillus sp. PK3_68 TaxID=2027408 RepID=UPI000E7264C1|nr:helix-turn-helix domain-containing protein [Bacillus sp. PK3_68]RJS60149.1 DNA-binding protein [Bacillus sp. PK3_68]
MSTQRLTPQQMAEYLGVTRETVYRMVRKNEIPHFKIRSRIFFSKETIDAWIRKQEQQAI